MSIETALNNLKASMVASDASMQRLEQYSEELLASIEPEVAPEGDFILYDECFHIVLQHDAEIDHTFAVVMDCYGEEIITCDTVEEAKDFLDNMDELAAA